MAVVVILLVVFVRIITLIKGVNVVVVIFVIRRPWGALDGSSNGEGENLLSPLQPRNAGGGGGGGGGGVGGGGGGGGVGGGRALGPKPLSPGPQALDAPAQGLGPDQHKSRQPQAWGAGPKPWLRRNLALLHQLISLREVLTRRF